jgi:YidC/Oxa1 family membrane protein insertase
MDRNTVLRWIVISGLIFVFWKWGMPMFRGGADKVQGVPTEHYVNAPGFTPDTFDTPQGDEKLPFQPAEGELCTIKGNRFNAELSTRGAALKHLYLTDKQYAGTAAFDMSTTPDHERWRSLRTLFRGAGGDDQVKFDRFNWKLEKLGESGCKFTYGDDTVAITKTITAGERPFELNVDTQVTNLADAPKKHRLAIEMYAFRRNEETKGNLGRVSPFVTDIQCARGKDVTRKAKDDFKSFKETGWFSQPLIDRYVAVSNYYFAQALVPDPADQAECRLLSENVLAAGKPADDDLSGDVYRAQLLYPVRELAPKATAEYKEIAFFGPKDRNILAHAAGGRAGLGDLINLGFFSPVAKVLVGVLAFFHDHVTFGNWGLAIIAMTICLRTLLFPLTWKSIKTTVAMRRFKPELDEINKKFEGDPQAKQMATMELWRKHGVNPLGGCLPQLVQMPIWFAMYTTLQTAVEMYHEKFLWFSDLSAPDKFYVLPLVLGGFMILQQRIVPQQGMDPMQQKMMMYLLPGVFTVMMLFLPAALGVYMLTNSVLGIVQQLAVEKLAPRDGGKKGEIVVKQADGQNPQLTSGGAAKAFGKGKARV